MMTRRALPFPSSCSAPIASTTYWSSDGARSRPRADAGEPPDGGALPAQLARASHVGRRGGRRPPSLVDYALTGRVQVLGFGTDGQSAPLDFGTIFVGYLVGAVSAEVSLARPARGMRRAASLSRRELEVYLPRGVLLAQRSTSILLALGWSCSASLCGVALGLQASDVAMLHSVMVLAAVVFLVLSLFACAGISESTWRVRRSRWGRRRRDPRGRSALAGPPVRAAAPAGDSARTRRRPRPRRPPPVDPPARQRPRVRRRDRRACLRRARGRRGRHDPRTARHGHRRAAAPARAAGT
jgi:hypothetical protein